MLVHAREQLLTNIVLDQPLLALVQPTQPINTLPIMTMSGIVVPGQELVLQILAKQHLPGHVLANKYIVITMVVILVVHALLLILNTAHCAEEERTAAVLTVPVLIYVLIV